MTDQATKTRKMSPKGFLAKTNAAKSAIGFIEAHRSYMLTGELAAVLTPIVSKVDAKELMPTPALQEIGVAVMNHIIAMDLASIGATGDDEPSGRGSDKAWVVQVMTPEGHLCTRINSKGEEEEMVKGFDRASDADRYADRRLFLDCWAGCYACIDSTTMNVHTIIHRQDSLARLLAKKKGPAVHVKAVSTKSLGFGVHCAQKRVSFSRG